MARPSPLELENGSECGAGQTLQLPDVPTGDDERSFVWNHRERPMRGTRLSCGWEQYNNSKQPKPKQRSGLYQNERSGFRARRSKQQVIYAEIIGYIPAHPALRRQRELVRYRTGHEWSTACAPSRHLCAAQITHRPHLRTQDLSPAARVSTRPLAYSEPPNLSTLLRSVTPNTGDVPTLCHQASGGGCLRSWPHPQRTSSRIMASTPT